MSVIRLRVKKLAQEIINRRTQSKLIVDGVFGPKSIQAAKGLLTGRAFRGVMSSDRWVAAVIQYEASVMLHLKVGAVDGFYGILTDDAACRLLVSTSGDMPYYDRPEEYASSSCKSVRKVICRNPSTAEFNAHYGKVGTNQGMVASPYPLKLDYDLDTYTNRFSAHNSLVSRIEAAMHDILDHYGLDKIQKLGLDRFGGCLNVRLKRGGTTPSTHSWGAAIDWFPSKNALKQTRTSALFAREDYKAFMDIWEAHGFMSLGRCFNFDWMHVQANPE